MDAARKKELKDAYKNKPQIGGVCCIRCSGNGHLRLQPTRDTEGLRNRFNFSMMTKGCPDPSLNDDWLKYGSESFTFTVLEELKRGEDQTDREFWDDVNVLYELWLEKARQGEV